MTLKEALEMLNKCGTNIEQPFEDYVLEALNKTLTELDELKRDVARFMELEEQDTFNSQEEHDEYYVLRDKLSKVGK